MSPIDPPEGSQQTQCLGKRPYCDFCSSPALEQVYTPIRSARGMEVFLCCHCGLVQSFPTVHYQSRPPGSMSADADRSSYRYTKDVISNRYQTAFSDHVDFAKVAQVLDVGSNRGAFVKWMESHHPGRQITAVEPDASVTGAYATLPNVTLHTCRFEHATLPTNHFDLAYCAHTLEHADSAHAMLLGVRRALKDGGLFFVAVPNLLFHADVIEELFIDPHTFHFNHALLANFVTQIGYSIEYAGGAGEADVMLLLKKVPGDESQFQPDRPVPRLADMNRANIVIYGDAINRNRAALKASALALAEAARGKKVVVWGGGRIFDALVRFGNLDMHHIHMVVDKFLHVYVNELHGCRLDSPKALAQENPDDLVVYIASRDYADEIRAEAGALGITRFIQFGKG